MAKEGAGGAEGAEGAEGGSGRMSEERMDQSQCGKNESKNESIALRVIVKRGGSMQ